MSSTKYAELKAFVSSCPSERWVRKRRVIAHAPDGTVNVKGKMCGNEGCGKFPAFGVAGTKTAKYCRRHALDGMANVKNSICITEGCDTSATFGVEGTKTAEYCRQHALGGMVNVKK